MTYASFGDSFDPAIEASFSSPVGLVSIDLTDLVTSWVDGSEDNHGLVFTRDAGVTTIETSEQGPQDRPLLEVCFLPPAS